MKYMTKIRKNVLIVLVINLFLMEPNVSPVLKIITTENSIKCAKLVEMGKLPTQHHPHVNAHQLHRFGMARVALLATTQNILMQQLKNV